MKTSLAVCLSLAAASLSAWGQTAAPTKVGTIHIQNAIMGTRDGQKAISELEAKSAPKKKELEQMQGEINSLRDQLNKTSSVGSEEQKSKLMRDIDAKTKSFNRQVEDAQAELDQDQSRILNEIGGRMLQVLDKYARDNGYAMILDISNQNTPVLFASNTIDVTRDIVGLYDKNAPAAAAPASGMPPASRPAVPGGAMTAPPVPRAAPGGAKPATMPGTSAPKPGAVK